MNKLDQDTLLSTNFFFKDQVSFNRGKVRDIYTIGDEHLVMIASDRISAFDHVLTSLINQAEDDINYGIPFEDGPILLRSNPKKINLGNSWYKNA